MKTLDEVIFEAPYSPTNWAKDALHYLREYRDKHEEMLQMEEALGYCEMAENRPLTWDELKQMEGKPVWVELTFPEGAYSHWGIIWGFPKAGYEFMELWGFHEIQSFSVMQKEQGKTWQAYRKERS